MTTDIQDQIQIPVEYLENLKDFQNQKHVQSFHNTQTQENAQEYDYVINQLSDKLLTNIKEPNSIDFYDNLEKHLFHSNKFIK